MDGLRRDYFGHMQYPAKARERGIQGTFLVTFQIRTDGSVSQVNTIEHKGRIDPLLKQAALDALQYMKPWHPGFIDGEAVAVNVLIPVSFTLR